MNKPLAVLRLLRVVLHFSGGLFTVTLVYPFCAEPRRIALNQRWSAKLLRILGITLKASGDVPPGGLVVTNHISFIDVFAINARMPSSFVAKDEVRRWPLIGWLAINCGTLFLQRGSRRAAQRAREQMVEHLRAGKRIAVFPEGTTSNGDSVLPFHSALFQAAIDAATTITPMALRYTDASGAVSYAAAYVGETTLLQCFWSIACTDGITVNILTLPPLQDHGGDRRHLAAHAHHAIRHSLNLH